MEIYFNTLKIIYFFKHPYVIIIMGCFVTTVSENTEEQIRKYIQNQKKK